MKDKKVLKRAIKKYGKDRQLMMVVEEIGELFHLVTCDMPIKRNSMALPHPFFECYDNKKFEEVADCQIMIEQLSIMTKQELKILDISGGVHVGVIFRLLDQIGKFARGRTEGIETEVLSGFYSWLIGFDRSIVGKIRKKKIKQLKHRLEG